MPEEHFFKLIDLERLSLSEKHELILTCPHCTNTYSVTLKKHQEKPDTLVLSIGGKESEEINKE